MATVLKDFLSSVEPVIERYGKTTLVNRWKEATWSYPRPKPIAWWVRETEDLVDIAWVTHSNVRDIAWYPKEEFSAYRLVPFSSIVGIESEESEDVGEAFGLDVSGGYAVAVHTCYACNGLVWVAGDDRSSMELRQFLEQLQRLMIGD